MSFAEDFNSQLKATRVDDAGAPAIIYIGYATPGHGDNPEAGVWAIKRVTDDGAGNIEVLFAQGKDNNEFVWDDRATYTYS